MFRNSDFSNLDAEIINIDAVHRDHKFLKKGLECFGFNEENLHEFVNLTRDEMQSKMKLYEAAAQTRWLEHGKRTLLHVTCSGHGVTVDGKAALVCNKKTPNGFQFFKIEESIWNCSLQNKGLYVIALFDICRTSLPPIKTSDNNRNTSDYVEADHDDDGIRKQNLIITHAGRPGEKVAQDSMFIPDIFKFFQSKIKMIDLDGQKTQIIELPGDIGMFRGSSRTAGTLPLYYQKLRLKWKGPPKGCNIFDNIVLDEPDEERKQQDITLKTGPNGHFRINGTYIIAQNEKKVLSGQELNDLITNKVGNGRVIEAIYLDNVECSQF